MSQKLRIILVAVSAVTLGSMAGFAQPAPQAGQNTEQARPQRQSRMATRLNLTDAQRDEIQKLREEHRAATREHAQKLREAKQQLHAELFADNPDQGKIATLKSSIAELSQQLQASRFEQQERYSRILTPEQRKLMREHRQFRGDRMHGKQGREFQQRGFRSRQFQQWQ